MREMRAVIALLLFAVGFLGPLVLEQVVKNVPVPESTWRWVATCLVWAGVIIAGFSDPFHRWVRRFREHKFKATAVVGILLVVGFASIWTFLIIGFPSPPKYVAAHLEANIVQWINSFSCLQTGVLNRPENYFTYACRFADDTGVEVCRAKNAEQFIAFKSWLGIGKNAREVMSKWPYEKLERLNKQLVLEAARAHVNCGIMEFPLPEITCGKFILISDLTQGGFYDALHEVHSNVMLMRTALDVHFHELDAESDPASPSPKSN